jgi:hypothetical protein
VTIRKIRKVKTREVREWGEKDFSESRSSVYQANPILTCVYPGEETTQQDKSDKPAAARKKRKHKEVIVVDDDKVPPKKPKTTQSKETPAPPTQKVSFTTGKKNQAPGKPNPANFPSIPKPTEAEKMSREALEIAARDQADQVRGNPPNAELQNTLASLLTLFQTPGMLQQLQQSGMMAALRPPTGPPAEAPTNPREPPRNEEEEDENEEDDAKAKAKEAE